MAMAVSDKEMVMVVVMEKINKLYNLDFKTLRRNSKRFFMPFTIITTF